MHFITDFHSKNEGTSVIKGNQIAEACKHLSPGTWQGENCSAGYNAQLPHY